MTRLLDQLPVVRGRYIEGAPLKNSLWFRVGGPAEILFKPKDTDDLCAFLQKKPSTVPVTVLGVGSNVLVRDGGIPGVVIKLGSAFSNITHDGTTLTAGAGALDRTVALTAASLGLGGFSFLSGIPGTIGGAVKMNAGAYGSEIKDIFCTCLVVTGRGTLETRSLDDLGFSYRKSLLKDDDIVVEATFKGNPSAPDVLQKEIDAILKEREASQPVRARTGGSTFKNPEGMKAWQLIDAAGFRSKAIGGAMVSEKHCNFLINTGDATACDLEKLGTEIQKQVLNQSGVSLEWEIKRLGIDKKD
jgi:UDP-N-acetylmuramate dehydrogenase